MRPSTFSFKSAAAALLLASTSNGQEIPPDFTLSSETQLGLAFSNLPEVTVVEPGVLIDFAAPRPNPPALGLAAVPADTTGPYMVICVDPDAPSPQNRSVSEILHWIQLDLAISATAFPSETNAIFPYSLTNASAPTTPYAPPMPPAGSDPHRYIFFLFEQPEDFAFPTAYAQFEAGERRRFNISGFVEAAGLGEPLAANYFLAQRPANATTTSSGSAAPTGATASATSSMPAMFTGGAVGLSVGSAGMLGAVGALFVGLL